VENPATVSIAPTSSPPPAESLPPEESSDGVQTADLPAPVFSKPDEMRAVVLMPGVDYPLDADKAEIQEKIDSAIATMQDFEMNTVVLETLAPDHTPVFASKCNTLTCAAQEFDAIAYAAQKAKSAGMYVFAALHLTASSLSDAPAPLPALSAQTVDGIMEDAEYLARLSPDGLLLDGYYNLPQKNAYAEYLVLGGAVGSERYSGETSQTVIELVRRAVREVSPNTAVGLLCEPVWANIDDNELGSATSAGFETLTDGNTDTLSLVGSGLADFLAVKALGRSMTRVFRFSRLPVGGRAQRPKTACRCISFTRRARP
jgi:hypothetical protein